MHEWYTDQVLGVQVPESTFRQMCTNVRKYLPGQKGNGSTTETCGKHHEHHSPESLTQRAKGGRMVCLVERPIDIETLTESDLDHAMKRKLFINKE